MQLSPALKEHIETKGVKLQQHYPDIDILHIILSKAKQGFSAEARIHLPTRDVIVHEQHADVFACIDHLLKSLDNRLRKQRDKDTQH